MKKFMAFLFIIAVSFFLPGFQNVSHAGVKTKAALICMNWSDVHWIRIKHGALARVEEFALRGHDIDLMCLAPENYDIEKQIEMVRQAIEAKVKYIIIACTDPEDLNGVLKEASDAGIKIIYVDSPATFPASVTYATDNFSAGAEVGRYLKKTLEADGISSGIIGIINTNENSESCHQRVTGFISELKDTKFMFVSQSYSDTNSSRAKEIAKGMIENGVAAIYGVDNYATIGASAAVREASQNSRKAYCVGWDASDENVEAVEDGSLSACLIQIPWNMGIMAVSAVVEMEQGTEMKGLFSESGYLLVTENNVKLPGYYSREF